MNPQVRLHLFILHVPALNHRLLICLLSALAISGTLSIDAYLPALPAITQTFGVTPATTQQTLTVYLFAAAFMSLFYGTLSDAFGRRPVILVSLAVYFLSSAGAGCADSIGSLMIFRVVQGFSAGAGGVVGNAILVDLLSGAEAQKAMAYIAAIFGIGPALAPILGGWLQAAFGWRSIFFFIALLTVILLLACYFWLPESLSKKNRHPFHFKVIISNYSLVGSHARFIFQSLGNALLSSGLFVYVGAAPVFIMNILHLSVKDFGWLFVPVIGGMTLGSFLAGKMSHRYSPGSVIVTAYVLLGGASLFNLTYTWFFTPTIPWAVVPLFFSGMGAALATPVMTVRSLEMFPNVRGLASSLQSFVIMAVFGFSSGIICPYLFGSAFLLACSLVAGMVLSLLFWQLGTQGDDPVELQ